MGTRLVLEAVLLVRQALTSHGGVNPAPSSPGAEITATHKRGFPSYADHRESNVETRMARLTPLAQACCAFAMSVLGTAAAQAQVCTDTVRVLAQTRDGLSLLEQYKDEFKKLSGASFAIDNLDENDRRAKSRADASTVGKYNVYYVDEANVALFAKSKWIEPLLQYYPKEYDYADFDMGRQKVATFDNTVWFAPLTGGGDLMVYRKDLLAKAGIQPPKTLDEFVAAVKKLHDPANGVYGVALRGQRGSGANVWRWMPYFRGMGGQWFEGDKPVFNSPAAVKATETYLELFKYSAPGTKTGSWDESTGAFLAGKVALLVESTPLAGNALDPKLSAVVGKVGYMPPPAPLTGGGYGHGLAVATKANKTEARRLSRTISNASWPPGMLRWRHRAHTRDGRSSPPKRGGERFSKPSPWPGRPTRTLSRRCAASACRGKCTAPPCSMSSSTCCGPPFCGTTPGHSRSARRLRAGSPRRARYPATS